MKIGRRSAPFVLGIAATCLLAAAAPARAETAWGNAASAAAGTRAEMFGAAVMGSADALVVGAYNPGQAPTQVLTQPYAQHWNGIAWTATPVPLAQLYVSQGARLAAAATIAPGQAWAVGYVEDVATLSSRTLAYRWDGAAWSRVVTPNPGGATLGNRLRAVVNRAASDAWAGGEASDPPRSLMLRWNGASWNEVYQLIVASPGCSPGIATAVVEAGVVTESTARIQC